jgi:hypothetical protein
MSHLIGFKLNVLKFSNYFEVEAVM